jgi:putative resolvase
VIHKGLTLREAAKYIGRHPKTLQAMDRSGILRAKRTSTNRRYWLKKDLDVYLGRTTAASPKRTVAYCRVSSQSQRPDLKNQRGILEEFRISRESPTWNSSRKSAEDSISSASDS